MIDGDVLTYEIFQRAAEQLMRWPAPHERTVVCHPLEYPFFRVFLGDIAVTDWGLVVRWYYECQRKHLMGAKTGDLRWTMAALVEQYTNKIAAIRALESEK